MSLFITELQNVLDALEILDSGVGFNLLGHSWGGLIALEYAADHPNNLKHLVLSNTFASTRLWVESLNKLLDQFPTDYSNAVRELEREGKVATKEYQEFMPQFLGQHLCRLNPLPQVILEGFEAVAADPAVRLAM